MSMSIGTSSDGSGVYGKEAGDAFRVCEAEALALIVINGKKGNGFSVIAPPNIAHNLPDILRNMADQIKKDIRDTVKN